MKRPYLRADKQVRGHLANRERLAGKALEVPEWEAAGLPPPKSRAERRRLERMCASLPLAEQADFRKLWELPVDVQATAAAAWVEATGGAGVTPARRRRS